MIFFLNRKLAHGQNLSPKIFLEAQRFDGGNILAKFISITRNLGTLEIIVGSHVMSKVLEVVERERSCLLKVGKPMDKE
jgi:hypothetical protein